jgi:hypothetical protein
MTVELVIRKNRAHAGASKMKVQISDIERELKTIASELMVQYDEFIKSPEFQELQRQEEPIDVDALGDYELDEYDYEMIDAMDNVEGDQEGMVEKGSGPTFPDIVLSANEDKVTVCDEKPSGDISDCAWASLCEQDTTFLLRLTETLGIYTEGECQTVKDVIAELSNDKEDPYWKILDSINTLVEEKGIAAYILPLLTQYVGSSRARGR